MDFVCIVKVNFIKKIIYAMHAMPVAVHVQTAIIAWLVLLAITGKLSTMAYVQLVLQDAPLVIMIQFVHHAWIVSIFMMIIVWTVLSIVKSVWMGPLAPNAVQGY